MKAKVVMALILPDTTSAQRLDDVRHQFKRAADRWSQSTTDHVLGLVLPEGTKFQAYAIPEAALVELPEIEVRVERELDVELEPEKPGPFKQPPPEKLD